MNPGYASGFFVSGESAMTICKLISAEGARNEACRSEAFSALSRREQELIDWLAEYIRNIPSVEGSSLLKECIAEVLALPHGLPISEFGQHLVSPLWQLANIVVFAEKAWDPFAGSLGDWFARGITEVRIFLNPEIPERQGQMLGYVLLNRALSFDEIVQANYEQCPLGAIGIPHGSIAS